MATDPRTKMLREITTANDRERTGVLDLEWDGTHASLFFLSGNPSHATLDSGDARLAGGEALTTLVQRLPRRFRVAPWRRAMVTEDTLGCTTAELLALLRATFQPGGTEDMQDAVATPAPVRLLDREEAAAPVGEAAAKLPLLPTGTPLWSDSMVNVFALDTVVPRLPDCLLVLDAPAGEGAAVITAGAVADAVWVAGSTRLVGDDAAHAVMTSTDGTMTAYRFDDDRVAGALPMLWRGAVAGEVPVGSREPDLLVAEVLDTQRTCAVVVEGVEDAVALFASGEMVAAYNGSRRRPVVSIDPLRELLDDATARVTVIDERSAAVQPPEEVPAVETGPAPVKTPAVEAEVANVAVPVDEAVAVVEVPADEAEADAAMEMPVPFPATTATDATFEPAMFSVDVLPAGDSNGSSDMAAVEAREATEFVAPRLDIDVNSLRTELTDLAVLWLGADDAAPVARVIAATRPGVDDFVSTIAGVSVMDISGHEPALVRAMAREMHFRATEVLCGV